MVKKPLIMPAISEEVYVRGGWLTSHEHCKSLKKPSCKWAYKFQVIYQATQKPTWLAGKSSFVVNDWSFPLSCYLSRCATPGSFGLFSPSERVMDKDIYRRWARVTSFKWDYSPINLVTSPRLPIYSRPFMGIISLHL